MPTVRYCHPAAAEAFAACRHELETPEGLERAAVAIARHHQPEASVRATTVMLDEMADMVRRRLPAAGHAGPPRGNRAVEAALAHLHDVLFDDLCFRGNEEDYLDPLNSCLPAVIERRLGIPISLSLVYHAVARRIGLVCRGVNAPGHFMIAIHLDEGPVYIDPWDEGRMLSEREARDRFRHVVPTCMRDPAELLAEADHRTWLARLLRNLIHGHLDGGRRSDVEAMRELMKMLG